MWLCRLGIVKGGLIGMATLPLLSLLPFYHQRCRGPVEPEKAHVGDCREDSTCYLPAPAASHGKSGKRGFEFDILGPKTLPKGKARCILPDASNTTALPSKGLLQFVIRIMDCVLAAGHGQLKGSYRSTGSTGSKGLSVDYSRGGGGEGPENGSAHAPADRRHCGLLCRRSRNQPPSPSLSHLVESISIKT